MEPLKRHFFLSSSCTATFTLKFGSWARRRCRTKAGRIIKDYSHPNNGYCSHRARVGRLKMSYFLTAIRILNKDTARAPDRLHILCRQLPPPFSRVSLLFTPYLIFANIVLSFVVYIFFAVFTVFLIFCQAQ